MPSIVGRLAILLVALSGCQLAGRKSVGEVLLRLDVPTKGDGFSNALYQTVGVELLPGHAVEWRNDGSVFEAMLADIGQAKLDINIVTFIWAEGKTSGRILTEIAKAYQRGVKCRVIIDAVGSHELDDKLLRAAGCEVERFRPIPGQDDLARNHRKMVIVDGRVGYTGGFGIDDKWMGTGQREDEWRDSNVRVRGPVVRAMQQAFAENWQEAGGPLLPPESFPEVDPAGKVRAALVASAGSGVVTKGDRLMQLLIAAAHSRLWIANAYFVPSEPILKLLAEKARQGVDVRVLTAGDKTDTRAYLPDQRARIARLLPEGVRAYEYEPTMMHSKTVLVDDAIFSVGSQNLDALSLNKMDEVMLVAEDRERAAELAEDFERDVSRSLEVKLPKDKRQRVSLR